MTVIAIMFRAADGSPGIAADREPVCRRLANPASWVARQRWRMALGFLLVVINAVSAAAGLDPNRPPGGNFDLSQWKLTLPDTDVTEIAPAQLAAGYTNADYFYTGPDGAMTFWCPVTGGVTTDTVYPRCELREMLDPNDNTVNWAGFGTNVLDATCVVSQVPPNPVVVIGQIHSFTGDARPLVKLELSGGAVQALVKKSPTSDSDTTYDFGSLHPGDLIAYQISLNNGLLSLTVNGSNHLVNVFENKAAWANQTFYFKAGNYVQDNSGTTNDGGTVVFYSLNVEHVPPAAPAPVAMANPAVDNQGGFSFTLRGNGPGTYYLQLSTNLKTWKYVFFTNSASGIIHFTDAPAGSAGFYRAGLIASNPLSP